MKTILGRSKPIRSLNAFIKKVAPARSTILIEGESGTGKELVAKSIHLNSNRRRGPFVAVNCGVFTDSLIESELFGHERGAFTGAVQTRLGRFERANGGTIFLDEIGELSPQGQVNLLRVLQERQLERVGGARPIDIDVRVVAATHRSLEAGVREGWFRKDLFYRLNVIRIHMPPLRERREDIPLLAEHFLRIYASENNKYVDCFSSGTIDLLKEGEYPGNVRELQNIVEKAVVLCDGDLIRSRDVKNIQEWAVQANAGPGNSSGRVHAEALMVAMKEITVVTAGNQVKPWHQCLKKVSVHAIHDFLVASDGYEFSRKAFTNYLIDHMKGGKISYKTVGDYLRLLKAEGICTHNSAHANRARYRLSERFIADAADCDFHTAPPPHCTGISVLQPTWSAGH